MYLLPELECLKCHHKWVPRVPGRPVQCPKCHNLNWDKPANGEVMVNEPDKARPETRTW